MPIFAEIEARLARAEEHVKALDGTLAPFTKTNAHTITTEKNANCTEHRWRVHFSPKPDIVQYGLLCGEIVHQLRSALDNLANRLVEASGGTPDTRTAYPIFEKGGDFQKAAPKILPCIRPDILTEIERLQPFQEGRDKAKTTVSWLIHRMNIMDKHRAILPFIQGSHSGHMALPRGCSAWVPKSLEDGAILYAVFCPAPMPVVKMNVDLTFFIGIEVDGMRVNINDILNYFPHEIRVITRHLSNMV